MARLVAQEDITKDNLNASPYLRINRSAILNLSVDWQSVTFNGGSSYNQNSFPTMQDGSKSVYLDTDKQTIRFNSPATKTYDMDLDWKVSGGTVVTALQLRFYIPAPTPIYFPFPETDGYCDLGTLGLGQIMRGTYARKIYANAAAREYGLQIQVRAVSITIVAPQLQEMSLFIYGA